MKITTLPAPTASPLATGRRPLPPAIGWSLGLIVSLALWAGPAHLVLSLIA
jgi:hypothetical protein